ncbi:NUDIX domain-containing protein [uncultured Erythrobacter sp.]|uniref:NUDIX hydrolase n=1 Tax=uncultured Erythrobacter sp. TaxID=263913 RepID=UPI00261261CC|nr:NUDIX domain-containing protein [uncultured Erythrobacter sp.]
MLHLITDWVERALPASLHRALLPFAHRIRHRWRKWRKAPIFGVGVILTNDRGEVLLIRHSYGPQVWTLPAGGKKAGEDPTECARREVREELGVEVGEMQSLGVIEEELSGSPHTSHLFTGTGATVPKPDQREIVEAQFFPVYDLPEPLGWNVPRRIEIWQNYSKDS